ncbi:MAG: AAA family ATPase [Erysipelotrichaceae bacterium]|nr:AAA family ATPase [Erysipelotrichaceae bacterium]
MKDIRTVEEILSQENTDEEWIWESIIRANTVNIISGDESSGKTTLMINLCKAISDEEEFLGIKTSRQKILYISSEMSGRDISMIFEKIGLKNRDNVKVLELHEDPLTILGYSVMDADLIVIDLFIQILINEGKDPNVYKDVNELYATLRKGSSFRDKTIILVHHLNKLGEINGSVSLGGASDTRMILSMPEGRRLSERKLSVYGKNVEQKDINIHFDFPSRAMTLSDGSESEKIDYELAYIIEQVIKRGEVSGNCQEVSAVLKLSRYGRNPNSLKRYLNANTEVLNENDIELVSERSKKERTIRLIHKPKVTE